MPLLQKKFFGKRFGENPFFKKGSLQAPVQQIPFEKGCNMLTVRLIAPGELKESYLREAVAEYEKRLGAYCRVEKIAIKEERLPDRPSDAEIHAALEAEADKILEKIPPRAYAVALCVEGTQFSSPDLAKKLEKVCDTASDICFVIGSSYGLAPEVKKACQLRLSVSELTFPHQLMRVILYETVYRCFNILKGTQYHK